LEVKDIAKELLFSLTKKDFELEFYRGSGAGGQNRNKVSTCCRIYHRASGAVAEACEERTQGQNKKIAFTRLLETPAFKSWHKAEVSARLQGYQNAVAMVDHMMRPENLKIEVFTEDGWKATS